MAMISAMACCQIVTGKRSLLSYAFGPIRQLRESLATGPEPKPTAKP